MLRCTRTAMARVQPLAGSQQHRPRCALSRCCRGHVPHEQTKVWTSLCSTWDLLSNVSSTVHQPARTCLPFSDAGDLQPAPPIPPAVPKSQGAGVPHGAQAWLPGPERGAGSGTPHLGTESWPELGGRLASIKAPLPGEPPETDAQIPHSFPYLPL